MEMSASSLKKRHFNRMKNPPQPSKAYSQSVVAQRVLKGLQDNTMQTFSRSTFPEQVKDLEEKKTQEFTT